MFRVPDIPPWTSRRGKKRPNSSSSSSPVVCNNSTTMLCSPTRQHFPTTPIPKGESTLTSLSRGGSSLPSRGIVPNESNLREDETVESTPLNKPTIPPVFCMFPFGLEGANKFRAPSIPNGNRDNLLSMIEAASEVTCIESNKTTTNYQRATDCTIVVLNRAADWMAIPLQNLLSLQGLQVKVRLANEGVTRESYLASNMPTRTELAALFIGKGESVEAQNSRVELVDLVLLGRDIELGMNYHAALEKIKELYEQRIRLAMGDISKHMLQFIKEFSRVGLLLPQELLSFRTLLQSFVVERLNKKMKFLYRINNDMPLPQSQIESFNETPELNWVRKHVGEIITKASEQAVPFSGADENVQKATLESLQRANDCFLVVMNGHNAYGHEVEKKLLATGMQVNVLWEQEDSFNLAEFLSFREEMGTEIGLILVGRKDANIAQMESYLFQKDTQLKLEAMMTAVRRFKAQYEKRKKLAVGEVPDYIQTIVAKKRIHQRKESDAEIESWERNALIDYIKDRLTSEAKFLYRENNGIPFPKSGVVSYLDVSDSLFFDARSKVLDILMEIPPSNNFQGGF